MKECQNVVAEPCQNAMHQPKVPISFSSMALILYINNLITIFTKIETESI